jgi:MFS family permease
MASTHADTGLRAGLAVLRHRDYATMVFGQFVSQAGTWMYNVTVPFVLFATTGSAVWVGFGGFAQYFPAMLAAPVGGLLADRFSRRLVMRVVSVLQMIVALVLALHWRGGDGSPWVTVGLVAILGVLGGIMLPSWQSLVPILVPREWLVRAVSLNSTVFNTARLVGPAVGGLVLARYGAATAFTVNGLSYAAVIVAVSMIGMHQDVVAPGARRHPVREYREGITYAQSHRGIVLAWSLAFSGAALGAPVIALSAVMAAREFHVDASHYGLLTAAVGLGAAIGGLVITAYAAEIPRSRLAGVALAVYGSAVLAYALAPSYAFGLASMFFVGVGLLSTNTTLNTSIQLKVDDRYRGRIMSMWAVSITGGLPLGSAIQGLLASWLGVRAAIGIAGTTLLAIVATLHVLGRFERLDPALEDERASGELELTPDSLP